jgi:hypothetical protein
VAIHICLTKQYLNVTCAAALFQTGNDVAECLCLQVVAEFCASSSQYHVMVSLENDCTKCIMIYDIARISLFQDSCKMCRARNA